MYRKLHYNQFPALIEAREQTHQAVQLVAMVGRALHPKSEDDHFANMEWLDGFQALVSNQPPKYPVRAALQVAEFKLRVIENDQLKSEFALHNRTLDEAMIWITNEFKQLGIDTSGFNLDLPYEMPVYATADGKAFELTDKAAFQELALYFANADMFLREIALKHKGASPVRCWPHHFDIATLITLGKGKSSEYDKSVGMGLSPGDRQVEEPYFYISPWPYPMDEPDEFPELKGGGQWHSDGWMGAFFQASEIIKGENQEQRIRDFLESGFIGAESLIEE